MNDLLTRLENLSASQRQCLVERLEVASPGTTQRLVAYLVSADGNELDVSQLRDTLRAKLPDFMIPNRFVLLEALPTTPNGKVDRNALPDPDQAVSGLEANYVAPTTETEVQLATLWSEILAVEPIGLHDNFFELGGHSLLVVQLVSKVRAAFDVDLPVPAVFDAPTVAELANQIDLLRWASEATEPSEAESTLGVEREEFVL